MADLKICRICLRTEAKVYKLNQFQLKAYYEEVTALKIMESDNLPHYVCYECAALLHKFHKFKEKCYCGLKALKEILWKGELTYESVYKLDKKERSLHSNLEIITETERIKSYMIIEENNISSMIVKNEKPIVNSDYVGNFEESSQDANEKNNVECEENNVVPVFIDVKKDSVTETILPIKKEKRINKQMLPERDVMNYSSITHRRVRFLDANSWKKYSLSEEEALKEFRARSEDSRYMKAAYKCTDCFKGFSKAEMLNRHLQLRHSEGQSYISVSLQNSTLELSPRLSEAVTVGPIAKTEQYYQLHAYVSRLELEGGSRQVSGLQAEMRSCTRQHPPGFLTASWPAGVRADPGMPPPEPDNRFDLVRWSLLNTSHAIFSEDQHAALPHSAAHKQALDLVMSAAQAWLVSRWPAQDEPLSLTDISLVEGARRWLPAYGLYYKLLLRVKGRLRQLEVVRPLGPARLVSVPYVTESARVTLLLTVTVTSHIHSWLANYQALCLKRDKNTDLLVVLIHPSNGTMENLESVRSSLEALSLEHRTANIRVVDIQEPISVQQHSDKPISARHKDELLRRAALQSVMPFLNKNTLLLTVVDDMEYNEDFLNRVRMNTISGAQWYSPAVFTRHAQYSHPQFTSNTNTGRFTLTDTRVLAVYVSDLHNALTEQQTTLEDTSVVDLLSRSKLRCIRAPEPAAIVSPPGPPCPPAPSGAPLASSCHKHLEAEGLTSLNLGAKHSLAKLILETQDRKEREM